MGSVDLEFTLLSTQTAAVDNKISEVHLNHDQNGAAKTQLIL